MGLGGVGQEDFAGRLGAGRGLQARKVPLARDPPHRKGQASVAHRGSAHRSGGFRQRGAGGARAGGRSQRHRTDRRSSAQARGAGRSCRGEGVMAQLTDDCFAFSGPLLPIADMERLLGERVTAVAETERVPLRGARGRVVSADVKAPVDLPPFDNSAVDGYAVRHADLRADGETKLAVAGRLTAGAAAKVALKPGEAIRIFTGAAMPADADTVFMQEEVRTEGDSVIVPAGLKLRPNTRRDGGEP